MSEFGNSVSHFMPYKILDSKMPDASAASPMNSELRRARAVFAAKVRAARAVLGLKQSELGMRAGLTQKSIHRIEHGTEELRRSTVAAIETAFRTEGIEFEEVPGGGFKVVVRDPRLG